MSVPLETELKFELEPRLARNIADHLGKIPDTQAAPPRGPEKLTSTYFDTPDMALRQQGVTLRVRRVGKRLVQTIKASGAGGGLFERAEWEQDIATRTPDRSTFPGTALDGFSEDIELVALFETRVDRTIHDISGHDVSGAGWEAELCIDRGKIVPQSAFASAETAVCSFVELEIELKSGAASALFGLAQALNQATPLRLGAVSKAGRGYALISGESGKVSKAEAVELDPDMCVRDAFRALARECLRHLMANTPILLESRDVEAVHQMRVAIRRLRAAISLFGAAVRDEETERVKDALRWIGRELGEARDLDVFIEGVIEPMMESNPGETGMAELLAYFQARRVEAYEAAINAVRGKRFCAGVIDTLAWVETGAWAEPADQAKRKLVERPVVDLADEELSRRRRKIAKLGGNLKDMAPAERHQLRIDIKKVRYAAEFFSSLYSGRKVDRRRRKLQELLASLQDSLGELNDLAVNREAEVRLTEIEEKGEAAVARRRAYAAGLLAGHQFTREGPLLRIAEKGYSRFRKAEPFWDE